MNPIAYAQENPITATAIVAVVVIGRVLLLAGGSSGGGDASYNPGNDPSVISAQLGLTARQYEIDAAARQESNAYLTQVKLAEIEGANSLALARLQYDTQGDISYAEIEGALAVAAIERDMQRDSLSTLAAVEQQKITAGYETTKLITDADLSATLADIAARRDATAINAQTNVQLAQIQGTTSQALAALNASTQQYTAGVVGQTQQQLAQTQASVAIAQTNAIASMNKQSGWLGFATNIIGAIL